MLTAQLEVRSPVLLGDAVQVLVRLANESDQPLRVLRWGTPFEGLRTDCFHVTHDGARVHYDGRLVKRGEPRGADFLVVPARGYVETSVDLTQAYDFTRLGTYRIELHARVAFVVGEGEKDDHGATRRAAAQLASEPVTLEIVPGGVPRRPLGAEVRAAPVRKRADTDGLEGMDGELGLDLRGGTAAQHGVVRSAHRKAAELVGAALAALPSDDARYTRWYGERSNDRFDIVEAVLDGIRRAIENDVFTYVISPEGCGSDLAYTTHGARVVSLCDSFFEKYVTGRNSRAGILVHELSHCAGFTEDHGYGVDSAETFAISDPDKAVNNADNHEYYCEDGDT